MTRTKFREVEEQFKILKDKFSNNEITNSEFKKKLEKLMVLDEHGSYWMMGGNSGKWYKYNGQKWDESIPDYKINKSETEAVIPEKAVEKEEPHSEQENTYVMDNDEKKEACMFCKSMIPKGAVICRFCGGNQKQDANISATNSVNKEFVFKSLNPVSAAFFFGGLGIILGVIIGAVFGIFTSVLPQTPFDKSLSIIFDARGQIHGGVIFALAGGILGFLAGAVKGLLAAAVFNSVSTVFGGLRFRIKS